MKKEELKKEFEESLKNIIVSDKLKEITLNNIYSKNNVYHLPYWIKNCAAIFVVTCICLSIYVVNNKNIFNKESYNNETYTTLHTEEYLLKSINDEKVMTDCLPESKMILKSIPLNEIESSSYAEDKISNDVSNNSMRYSTFSITTNGLTESYTDSSVEGITEEEFLENNPNAQQTENGYIVVKNDVEVFYELKNGFVYEINN